MQATNAYPYAWDVKLKGVQGVIPRAAVPDCKLCEEIMHSQKKMSMQQQLDLGRDSIALFAAANQQLNQIRRDLIKPSMSAKIREVIRHQVKEEEASPDLFPDLAESAKAAKQVSSIIIPYSSYGGRGRGRRMGGGPYGRCDYGRGYGGQ